MTDKLRMAFEDELSAALRAIDEKNDGKARVCCRRAVGLALGHFKPEWHQKPAIERLRMLATDSQFPDSVRNAARRLQTNVRHRLSPDFTFNPVLDARLIYDYFKQDLKLP